MDSPDVTQLLNAGRSKRAMLCKVQGPQQYMFRYTCICMP